MTDLKIDETRSPVVVVDRLHVKYRAYSSGKTARAADQARTILRRRTGGLRTVHALRGVSFVAYKNESVGVIGANGSGKSTLMRAITGLTPPAAGAVFATSRPNMLGVGAALMPDLSGDRNVILGGLALGLSMSEVRQIRNDVVEFSGLQEFIDMPMRTYSSGMSARLKFSIAAVRDHEILIIDEALAVGDNTFRLKSEERIREIRNNAGTVFLVSHNMRTIRDTCSRVLWINKGELIMDGDPDEVVDAYMESR